MANLDPFESEANMPFFTVPTDHQVSLPAIMRRIRLCRSALGAILDDLEGRELNSDEVQEIVEPALNVIAEIERLLDAVMQSRAD